MSETFESLLKNREKDWESALNNVIEVLNSSSKEKKIRLYATLISIDLTQLNSMFNQDKVTQIKNHIIEVFGSDKESLIFTKIQGGRVLFITKKQFSLDIKKQVHRYVLGLENSTSDKSRLVYISEERLFPLPKSSTISLLLRALRVESYLQNLRKDVQTTLDGKAAQKYFSFDPYSIKIGDRISFSQEDFLSAKSLALQSYYLAEIFEIEYDGATFKNEIFVRNNLQKYFLWISLQKLAMQAYKIEKVYQFFRPVERSHGDKSEIYLDSHEKIKSWFYSVVVPLQPYVFAKKGPFYERKQTLYLKIKSLVDSGSYDLNFGSIVKDFFQDLRLRGIQNIPLGRLSISKKVEDFFKLQFSTFFPNQEDNFLKQWLRNEFVKPNFYLSAKGDRDKFYDAFKFLNFPRSNPNVYLHGAFLEIDGFNAFNHYLFPQDADQVYSKILNSVQEVASDLVNSSKFGFLSPSLEEQKVLKTLTLGVLGDEFFIAFKSSEPVSEHLILSYLKKVQKKIVDVLSNYRFVKTEKKKVKVQGKGKVVFREIIRGKNGETEFEIGRISVSGTYLTNIPFKWSQDHFVQLFDDLETIMERVKEYDKGEIIDASTHVLSY